MTSEELVKIVFWDLDGTLWRGTLEEDSEQATLPVEVLHNTLLELDRRGILNSIVSQASQAAAVAKLNQLNLLDLFIHPVFDASSKAQAVAVALQQLNLLPVNAAFVDDQPFHRAEVTALLPGVLTLPPEELPGLLHTSRFSSVSTLGSQRRQMYKAEEQREDAQRSFGGNRAEFLKACKMVLTCRIATQDDQQRLAELFVRTHRLSSSPAQASRAIASSAHSIYAASLCDRFGDYGLVGGAVLYTGATAKLDPVTTLRALLTRLALLALLTWLHANNWPFPVGCKAVAC